VAEGGPTRFRARQQPDGRWHMRQRTLETCCVRHEAREETARLTGDDEDPGKGMGRIEQPAAVTAVIPMPSAHRIGICVQCYDTSH
jgi:hypothetical protein